MVYVRFRCKPMVEDLLNLGFSSSKSLRKSIPRFSNEYRCNGDKIHSRREILLAWLLGYYDGDGFSKTTRISSSSKEFLERIKSEFGIRYKVRLHYDSGNKFYLEGVVSTKLHWKLCLGASLFNEMIRNYEGSMPRKRMIFKEKNIDAYNNLKATVINKENLQNLVDKHPISHLIKKINVSVGLFYKLCKEWNITTPRMKKIQQWE